MCAIRPGRPDLRCRYVLAALNWPGRHTQLCIMGANYYHWTIVSFCTMAAVRPGGGGAPVKLATIEISTLAVQSCSALFICLFICYLCLWTKDRKAGRQTSNYAAGRDSHPVQHNIPRLASPPASYSKTPFGTNISLYKLCPVCTNCLSRSTRAEHWQVKFGLLITILFFVCFIFHSTAVMSSGFLHTHWNYLDMNLSPKDWISEYSHAHQRPWIFNICNS